MRTASTGSIVVCAAFEVLGSILAVWLFGLTVVAPVFAALVAVALTVRGLGATSVFILANGAYGFAFAVIGFVPELFWAEQLLGALAVVLLVNHFATPAAAPVVEEA